MANKITFNRRDDEHLVILVDGDAIGYFNHDEHGWAGMEAAEKLATRFAEKLGLEIEETFEDD